MPTRMSPERTNATIESLLAQAGWLDALARRLVADPHEADEIVQETWIAAIQHPPHLSVPVRSWLARVARNFALQRGRSESARRKREQSLARDEARSVDEDAVDRALAQQRLVDAVVALAEPYRSTVILHYFDHVPVAEIAERQSAPESTVRTRLSRAIAMLRENFQREGGDTWSLAFVALVPKSKAVATAASTSTAAWSSGTVIGGIAMATAWKIGASIAAAIVLGWALWPKHDDSIVRGLDVAREPAKPVESLSGAGQDGSAVRVALAKSDPADSVGAGAATTSAKSDTTSLDVHVRWGDDGTPAAGVVVSLNQWGAPDPSFDDAAARTDSEGHVHFDGVFAGDVQVSCDRGGSNIAQVVADRAATFELTIPNGIDVDGIVVDENKVPVPDARILISRSGADDGGPDIERSDARGRFHLRDVKGQKWIAALHNSFGPSAEENLFPHVPGSRVDLVLVLSRSRGVVTGFVHDEHGQPIPRAKAGLKLASRSFTDEAGRNAIKPFPSLQRFTDASGAFSAAEVGEGRVTLSVEARGFVRWQQSLGDDLRNGPIDVRMSTQAVVHGVVRDPAGTPVNQAMVTFSKSPQESGSTYSRADGSYRLEHLPRGPVEIHVFADEQGEEQKTFELEPGQDIEWNITLKSAPSVEGSVVDESGKPIAGWLVGAIDPERPGGQFRSTHTNDAGAFVLGNWPAKASAVEVREPDGWFATPAALVTDVKAGDKGLAIKIPATSMRTAFIHGRLFDMDGHLAASQPVTWMAESIGQGRMEATDAEGRFRLGPFRPGSYSVDFRIEGQAPKSFHGLALVSGQELELGDVHLEHGGSLVVHLRLPAGTNRERAYPSLDLCGKDPNDKTSIALRGDEGRLTTIASGEYDVVFRASELRAPKTHVTITSDHLTEIDVTAERGADRTIELVLPEGDPRKGKVRLRVVDEAGVVVSDDTYPMSVATSVGVEGLKLGVYTVEATTDTGLSAHATLTVESFEPSMDWLKLQLH